MSRVVLTVMRGLMLLLMLAAAARAQVRDLAGVTVHFTDGSQEHLERSAGPATRPAIPKKSLMGVNTEGLRDYSRSMIFIDAMKTSRLFASPGKPWSGTVTLDANGWPTTDAGAVVMTETINAGGVYRFSCTGPAVVKAVACPGEVKNLHYDPASNTTSADVVFAPPPNQPAQMFLSFTGTVGGIRDIKLFRPGYADDAQIFTNEFLASLEPFGTLRFMDFLRTNDSKIVRWDERAKVSDAQFTSKGGPYELAIELGNRTKKDIWLHVPVGADDDFVEQLARLVKNQLAPDIHCYLEYSNEIWNSQFSQQKTNRALAAAEIAAGDRTLNDDGLETNTHYIAWRRVGKRTIEIAKIFRNVMGDDPRIRVVLAGQHVNPRVLQEPLGYIEKHVGPPGDYLYGIATAPYFGNKKEVVSRENLTVDDVCNVLLEKVTAGNNRHVQDLHQLARKYSLKSVAYEGGVDLGQSKASLDAKTAAQFDPRAGEAVEKYLSNWFESGGDVFIYYNHICRYTRWGFWGLSDDVRKLDVPKMQAAARVAKRMQIDE